MKSENQKNKYNNKKIKLNRGLNITHVFTAAHMQILLDHSCYPKTQLKIYYPPPPHHFSNILI